MFSREASKVREWAMLEAVSVVGLEVLGENWESAVLSNRNGLSFEGVSASDVTSLDM